MIPSAIPMPAVMKPAMHLPLPPQSFFVIPTIEKIIAIIPGIILKIEVQYRAQVTIPNTMPAVAKPFGFGRSKGVMTTA